MSRETRWVRRSKISARYVKRGRWNRESVTRKTEMSHEPESSIRDVNAAPATDAMFSRHRHCMTSSPFAWECGFGDAVYACS